ncbi:MAG: BrnT family toxin [Rhodocyclaceae bacterium]|nr:MAG: BrnT family toxin [Rhodocyclaceae bacterium]
MIISWKLAKNRANQKKHGLSFDAAQFVFDDPLHLTRQDGIEGGEMRWQTIGMVEGVALLLVAHTVVDNETGETHIHIISARRATKLERKHYEQNP